MITESADFVNVQVIKNGSSDIALSVFLSTTAGSALGNYLKPGIDSICHRVRHVYIFTSLSWG